MNDRSANKNRLIIVAVALAIFATGLVWAQEKAVDPLVITLKAEKPEYRATERLNMRFAIVNTSAEVMNVLTWRTPLEGFNDDMFLVEKDDRRMPYLGRVVKRGALQPEDYVAVNPGDSISVVVDLAEAYGVYDAGDYTVEYQSALFDVSQEEPKTRLAKEVFRPKEVRTKAVSFTLLENRVRPALRKAPEFDYKWAEKTPVFKDCSQSRTNQLNSALSKAQDLVIGAQLALYICPEEKRPDALRYKKWFGSYTETRYDKVISNFDAIYHALAYETITFNCDCDENWYAYVYPSRPYEIWLCNAFWSAPLTGKDSKAGTIIHEVSHFYVVAGTDDYAYGHTACINLANNNPSQAINNADSYEYFAENDPSVEACGLPHIPLLVLAIVLIVIADSLLRRRRRATDTG